MLTLRKALLFLAVGLPVISCIHLLINLYSQSVAILDGPLSTPFQKSFAIREIGIAFFISALIFFLTSIQYSIPRPNNVSWLKSYFLVSAFLIIGSVILFLFLPDYDLWFFREFHFSTWSRTIDAIHYLIRDFTFVIIAIFIVKNQEISNV